MTTSAQMQALRILARATGWSVRTKGNELRIGDSHGDMVFSNDSTGIWAAMTMLRQLKQSAK